MIYRSVDDGALLDAPATGTSESSRYFGYGERRPEDQRLPRRGRSSSCTRLNPRIIERSKTESSISERENHTRCENLSQTFIDFYSPDLKTLPYPKRRARSLRSPLVGGEMTRKKESCYVKGEKKPQSYATLMLLIRVPTIIRSDGSFVHPCPQKKKKTIRNHLTVATFILSYKDDGQFIHSGEEMEEVKKKKKNRNFTGIYSWHWRDGERGSGPDTRNPREGLERQTGDHRHGRYTTLARSSVLYFPFFRETCTY